MESTLAGEFDGAFGQQIEHQSAPALYRGVMGAAGRIDLPAGRGAVEARLAAVLRHNEVDLAVGVGMVRAARVVHIYDVDRETRVLFRRLDGPTITQAARLVLT